MNASKDHKRLLAYLEKWIANPSNDRRKDWTKALRKALNDKSPHAVLAGAMQLWFFANWHAQHGLHQLIQGNATGWRDVNISLEYRWLHQRLNAAMTQVSETALLMAHCWLSAQDERTTWLESRLLDLRLSSPLWPYCQFGEFLLRLRNELRLQTSAGFSNVHMPPVYESLLQSWSTTGSEANASMASACDYHLAQALSQSGYPDFALSPYDLMPLEFMLVNALRKDRNLEPLTPCHPLTSLPLLLRPHHEVVKIDNEEVCRLVNRALDQGVLTR